MAVTPTIEVEFSAGVWTDVSGDLIRDPIRWNRGISGAGPLDRIARPGSCAFTLDNSSENEAGTEGYYSPGHPSVASGWRHGTRMRLHLTDGTNSRYVFRGRLSVILPDPGGDDLVPSVSCLASDWMAEFSELDAVDLALLEDATSDELMDALVALAPSAPAHTDFDTGRDVYGFAFDDLGGDTVKAPSVAQDILQSELGFLYVRGDQTDGETLRFENRDARATATSDYTFTIDDVVNDPNALRVPSTLDGIFNIFDILTFPRRVDAAATSVLVQLDSPIEVSPGRTETLFADYQDPNNEAVFVGGKGMVPLAGTTDWTANDDRDGAGSDVSADFTVTASFFGSRCMIEMTNNGSVTGYVRGPGSADGLQARGRGLYRYRPVVSRSENASSIAKYGRRPLPNPLVMAYQSDRNIGQGAADYLASLYGGLTRIPEQITIANDSVALEAQAILRDIGDAITIDESVTGCDETKVFINAVSGEFDLHGRLQMTYTLAPADTSSVFILDDPEAGILDLNVLGYA